jgi:hypothetical protein
MSVSTAQRDYLVAGSIFLLALLVFWFSPVHQLTDSNYSMLLSENLIKHRTFVLDAYKIPRFNPNYHDNTLKDGQIYQLEYVGCHLYYYFPPGSSVLSIPFVALANAFGVSAANADGSYNPRGEERIETALAAILMAALAAIFFLTGRLVLPLTWSTIVALGGTFATQVWSTASRALWSDTWGILLLSIVVWMLLAHAANGRKLNSILLATLLAWLYFVRPTNSVSIVAITIYSFIFYRERFLAYALAGALWLAAFVAYSWYNFRELLPKYFLLNRLSFGKFWPALAGNLISPSRGLLIFVPVLGFVFYLLIRRRRQLPFRRLSVMALAIIVVHLIVIAGFVPWYGGFSYGPRYTTGVVPWFVLLSIVAITAMLNDREMRPRALKTQLAIGAVLFVVSVMMNARGAISQATGNWNSLPVSIDNAPARIWDWRYPQFLAGFIYPPLPKEFPLLKERTNFASHDADKFSWYGWSAPEPQIRWSDGDEAGIIFGLDQIGDSILRIKMGPFLARGIVDQQVFDVSLNGQRIQRVILNNNEGGILELPLAKEILKNQNRLTFKFLNATAPKSIGVSDDVRKLGIWVEWFELQAARP